MTSHRRIKFVIGGTNDVELRIERQCSAHWFQVRRATKRLLRSLESLSHVGDNLFIIGGIIPERRN